MNRIQRVAWFVWGLLLLPMVLQAQFSLYLDQEITVPSREVGALALSADGRFLAIGDGGGRLFVWDIPAGRQLHNLKAHGRSVAALVFDTQNRRLVSGGKDGKVKVWDLYSGQAEIEIKDFRSPVSGLALSPDDRFLAVSGNKREIYLYEFPLGRLKGKLKGHGKDVINIAFSQGGDQLFSVGKDRQMIVWDAHRLAVARKAAMEARTLDGSGLDLESAVFSPDRRVVGIGVEEHVLAKGGRSMIFKHNLSFFDWATGAEIATLTGNRGDLQCMVLSPDKEIAVTDHGTLQKPALAFWRVARGVIEQSYPLEGKAQALAISENGQRLAAAHGLERKDRCAVKVWTVSGLAGYERFAQGEAIRSGGNSGFGATITVTTPKTPLIDYGSRRRLAVLPFDAPGLEPDLARTAAYLLESKLGNSPLVELVERAQISQVLEELKFQQTGMTTSDAAQVGAQLGATHMLLGSINKLGTLLIVTAKLVNVESGQIEGTREVQCANATIETLAEMIAVLAPTLVKTP